MSELDEKRVNISQKRSKALRYLLLRHLWKNRDKVPHEVYLEVANSLSISKENGKYVINWKCKGKPFKTEIAEQEISFYQQGINRKSTEQLTYNETKNNLLAQQFAVKVLGIQNEQGFRAGTDTVYIEPYYLMTVILNWVGCSVLLWALGVEHLLIVLLLGITISLEFVRCKGKYWSVLLFFIFPFLGFPWISLIGGCVYSLLHFLDPNPYYRVLRVVTSLVTGLVGFLFVFSSNETINFEPKIITFFFVCIIIAVYRTMLLTHARRMPLVLPFLGPAFYLDGYPVAGWYVAGFSFFGIIILLNKNSIFQACSRLFKYE